MRRGGLYFAALVLIGGFLRLTGPGQGSAQNEKETSQQKNTPREATVRKIPYLEKLSGKIDEFYGVGQNSPPQLTDVASHLKSAHAGFDPTESAQLVIAILPDPVHTHLALSFDRGVEALQQAAQMKGYAFERAILPWERTPPPASDLRAQEEASKEQAEREAFPGLLIFRPGEKSQDTLITRADKGRRGPKSPKSAKKRTGATGSIGASARAKEAKPSSAVPGETVPTGPLFVFVVGETPTSGLNKKQFQNALTIIKTFYGLPPSGQGSSGPPSNSPGIASAASAPQTRTLLILGPTFSGSLASLQQELRDANTAAVFRETFIYSGTATQRRSLCGFETALHTNEHFSSFQENDDYARHQFLLFAADRGYPSDQIAILSEDDTVYGATQLPVAGAAESASPGREQSSANATESNEVTPAPNACDFNDAEEEPGPAFLQLHFPREISYFRSEYQKESSTVQTPTSANPSGLSTLPLDLQETGKDDDAVEPYAGAHTALSQEAVMLGIVSELQKHRIKFTLLLATDPLDQLFLATYLRKGYAQGRVVVTAPDLLFARQGDPQLSGVLGLSAYPLVSGLSDRLCRQQELTRIHEDRLFVSSLSVGTFNAMVGLLSAQAGERGGWAPARVSGSERKTSQSVPYAPYADYGSPGLFDAGSSDFCEERPELWLTMLGRGGFWPVAGLAGAGVETTRGQEPIAHLADGETVPNTLDPAFGPYSFLSASASADSGESRMRTPTAWKIAYCVWLLLLFLHAALSLSGNVLADSEARAQFARCTDTRGNLILAIGAITLASAFVLVVCTRIPLVDGARCSWLTCALWLPYVLFVAATIWDLGKLRRARIIAGLFAALACGMTFFQIWLAWFSAGKMRVYWSTRMLLLSSGVSPILPILLLMGAGYWWMWMSLRGVCLVDLRRPRLPQQHDLPTETYRISDTEGEELRTTAHPFFFAWQVLIPIFVLAAILLTGLDQTHPVQTIEGAPFDWGYTLLLSLLVGTFLGCLIKLVRTWLKCRQVLAGLDRLPLRVAFSRMKDLSWHSFWNPGGSSLRETYKVMQRATENQTHLLALVENWETPMSDSARRAARKQIRATIDAREALIGTYGRIFPERPKETDAKNGRSRRASLLRRLRRVAAQSFHAIVSFPGTARTFLLKNFERGCRINVLLRHVENLQKEMARTAGVLIRDVLTPLWLEDSALTVSTADVVPKTQLPVFRAMAEEYAALVYVNFLVSVLLRIRTLVICAGGLYVLIVLSLNTYPFEPHAALQTLAVVLILAMAAAVGYVYAEMHREVILSRLTSTTPGELGLDFWIKFMSAGAIPVFSLLAAQFPSINQFLFSWLEPALQALK
jgi:hypothetical protein